MFHININIAYSKKNLKMLDVHSNQLSTINVWYFKTVWTVWTN